jgi:hypothetical protein
MKNKKKKTGCLIPIIIVFILLAVIVFVVTNSESNKAPFEELVNQPLSTAISKVDELEYSAKYFYDNGTDNNDYTDTVKDVISKDEEELNKYVITRYKNLDTKNKSVDLYINTKDKIKKQEKANELENKLGHINACQAVETYGAEQYPYGFTLHYASDLQGYEVTGENSDSWKIKCSATITTAFGTTEDVTCEAVITGTNETPNVTSFEVY